MYEELTRYLEALNFSKNFVRRYLASEICFGKVSTNKYDVFQNENRLIIHPCSDCDTFAEIMEDFKKIEGEMLGKIEEVSDKAKKDKNKIAGNSKTIDANDGDPDM